MVRIGSGIGDEVESQAAAWAIICAERTLTTQEQQQFDRWIGASSRHLGAWVRAQAIWADVDRVVAIDQPSRAEAVEPRRTLHWRRYAMAASFVVAMISGVTAYDRLEGRVSTARGEVREIALEDGSRLMLNSDSVVQIRFDGDQRRVILRRGEASFDVAHDSARPFLVTADDVTVRAVGTRFAVDMADDDVEVTVEEGVVAVTEPGSSAPARLLRRNQQFVAAPTGVRRAALDDGEIGRQLAWRRRQLVFNGESLGRAAEQVNRYSDVRVTIDDPTLARAEFIGVFRMGDGRAFAHAAAQAFNGQVIARDDGLHLQRRPNSPSH